MAASLLSPNPDNYYVGRGIVWWGRFDALGARGAWRDLGNAPALNWKPAIKNLDHFSSRFGTKSKDASVVIEANGTLVLQLDEWTRDNLALAMMGFEGVNPIDILSTQVIKGSVFFLGTNDIGAKFALLLNQVQFTPTGVVDFISADKYGVVELTGDVLADPTVPVGQPQFGTLEWGTAAVGPP